MEELARALIELNHWVLRSIDTDGSNSTILVFELHSSEQVTFHRYYLQLYESKLESADCSIDSEFAEIDLMEIAEVANSKRWVLKIEFKIGSMSFSFKDHSIAKRQLAIHGKE